MKNFNNSNINPYIDSHSKPKKISDFYNIDLEKSAKALESSAPEYWEERGQKMALDLFHKASDRVPAYKDFLKRNKINSKHVKTIEDFKKVPHIEKNNYLRKYPLKKLCWDGKIEDNTLLSVSSGSSGSPFFWPRGDNLELETSLMHALFLKKFFHTDTNSTLFINSFSMGIYIAGIITLNSVLRSSQQGMPISVVSPGIEINDIIRSIENLGKDFDQIILAGYPPFIKDIIEEGERRGLKWKKYNIKFLFATESISEPFRDYVFSKVGTNSILHDSLNIYGSADAGILGHETPLSVYIRRAANKDRKLFNGLWPNETFSPTFVQYNPVYKFFEEDNEELIFSCYGGIPLLRYNIHDKGRIIPFNEAIDLSRTSDGAAIKKLEHNSWRLPFISVFGRSDLTISFYGLMIYPQNIKTGLENKKVVSDITGKFVMQKIDGKDMEQKWEVYLELKKDVPPSERLKKKIKTLIVNSLKDHNLEYEKLYNAIGKKAEPTIHLIDNDNKDFFDSQSIKQRWVKP